MSEPKKLTREDILKMASETIEVPKYSDSEISKMLASLTGDNDQKTPDQNAPKIWTEAEIETLRKNDQLTDEVMNEIRLAANEGRIK